jgi:hypothetical protein
MNPTPPHKPAPNDRARFARAAQLAGFTLRKWRSDTTAELTQRSERHTLDMHAPALQPPPGETAEEQDHTEPRALAARIAAALDRPLPDELLHTPTHLRALLRPRLIDPAKLRGDNKAAARRDAAAGLAYAIASTPNPNARLLRTADLDAWNATFDDAFNTATAQAANAFNQRHVHQVEDAPNLHAIVHETESAEPAHLFLDQLLPGFDPDNGALFALPAPRTILALPINTSVGARGLAALVQTAFLITKSDNPTHNTVFWIHPAHDPSTPPHQRLSALPTSRLEEHDALRVQLDLSPEVIDLLKRLGEDTDHQTP